MTPERRQKMLLGALLLLLLVVGWTRLWPLLTSGGGGGVLIGRGSAEEAEIPEGKIVELATLAPEVRNYRVKRDPFRFGEIPRPKPTPPPPPPPQPVENKPPPTPVETGPALPPLELSYLGKFGPKKSPIAVLTDGETLYNAQEGDSVNEHFRVRSINLESIDLEYIQFPDQPAQRLPVGS